MSVTPENLCQLDLTVSNIDRSLRFYAGVFAWTEAPCEIFNYHVLNVPKTCPFGIALIEKPDHRFTLSALCLSFSMATKQEILDAFGKVETLGGQHLGERKLPGYGYLWEFCDPDGQRYRFFKKY